MGLEARAVRRESPSLRVVEGGIALGRLSTHAFSGAVISCGVAGGLRTDLETGTVLIPRSVQRPDGEPLECDAGLVAALDAAARRLGFEPEFAPMLTSATIVHGAERASWANRGFAGVDMETGLLEAPRVAAVRVILDTPLHELSADWAHPVAALLRPKNWPEAMWLGRTAPRSARVAARVLAAAVSP